MDSLDFTVEDRRVQLFYKLDETWWTGLIDEGWIGVPSIAFGLERLFHEFDQELVTVHSMRLALAASSDDEPEQWVIHRMYSIELNLVAQGEETMVEGVMRLAHDPDPEGYLELFTFADGDDVPLMAIAAAEIATEVHKDQVNLFLYHGESTEIFLLLHHDNEKASGLSN